MDSKLPEVTVTAMNTRAGLYKAMSKPEKTCFSGLEIADISFSEADYVFLGKIGSGQYGEVYRVQSKRNPLNHYAIKKIELSLPLATRYSDNELRILELIRKKQHPNIINFYGWFDNAGYRFQIFQLGNINFSEFLDNNLYRLNSKHANEILHQMICMAEALSELEIQADDFNKKNMIFCSSDRKIKLIDFEKYLKPNQTGYISPFVILPLIGLEVSEIQIEIEKSSFRDIKQSKRNFSRASRLTLMSIYFKKVPSLNSQELLSDSENWNKSLPENSRELIAHLFNSDVDFNGLILPMRDSLEDRLELS